MSEMAILPQTPEGGRVLSNGRRFQVDQAKRLPNALHVTSMINMRQGELNGAGTMPSAQAAENLHSKSAFKTKKVNPATPQVNTP